MLLAFMSASPEELGYDSTVQVKEDNDGRKCFVYQVGDRYFKTERSLYSYDALYITGRGTILSCTY